MAQVKLSVVEIERAAKSDDEIANIVARYVEALKKEIDVEKVILAGRYADGSADGWDDIEVAVVSRDFEVMNPLERLEFLALKTAEVETLLVVCGGYTPYEYGHPEETTRLGWYKSAGKVVYDKGDG